MTEEQFIQKNSSTWKDLEAFYQKVNKKGIKVLEPKEVQQFLYVFRVASHHLAYARTHYSNSNLSVYLNSLVGKAQTQLYAVNKLSSGSFLRYITYGFSKSLKDNRYFVLSSFGLFFLGFLVALVMTYINEGNAGFFMPQDFIESIKAGKMGGGEWNYPIMSGYIMVNNITVSLKAFVYGITLGLGTFYVLFTNGAMLGALSALVYMYGNPTLYWSLILPHGIFELTAIFISGAAGLIIAYKFLLPGEYTRKHSLIQGAKEAIGLMGGVVVMLIVAGIIEGFFTPLKITSSSKLIFAAVTGGILFVYILIPYFKKKQAYR